MRERTKPLFAVVHLPGLRMYALLAAMLLVLCLLHLLPAHPAAQAAFSPALFGVSVVIDAGHGEWDPGMVGETCVEKDVNLAVAQALAEYCRAGGAGVTLTRESDAALADRKQADLQARAALAEQAGADVFISLHCNSYPQDAGQHGAQVFYQNGNAEGQLLAEAVQQALRETLGNTDRAALPHPGSYLLEHTQGAAVLCEMGFLSNAEEEALLNSETYRWQMAWAIYHGLHDYLHGSGAQ